MGKGVLQCGLNVFFILVFRLRFENLDRMAPCKVLYVAKKKIVSFLHDELNMMVVLVVQ